jgi:hypothetical protein
MFRKVINKALARWRSLLWGGWVLPVEAEHPERMELPGQETEQVRQERVGEENGKPLPDVGRAVDTSCCPGAVERHQELWVDRGGES